MNNTPLIIKVCGVVDEYHRHDVEALGVDLTGLIFVPESPRVIIMENDNAPADEPDDIMPIVAEDLAGRVGVMRGIMPQKVIQLIRCARLNAVQFHGHESPTYLANLRHTIIPDLWPDLRFIKTIHVSCPEDLVQCTKYDGVADYLLLDTASSQGGGSGLQWSWEWLDCYAANTPFLLSGGIGPDDAERVAAVQHPLFAGVDVNSRFEEYPGHKDLHALHRFVTALRALRPGRRAF